MLTLHYTEHRPLFCKGKAHCLSRALGRLQKPAMHWRLSWQLAALLTSKHRSPSAAKLRLLCSLPPGNPLP